MFNWIQFLLGFTFLVLGSLEYLIDRGIAYNFLFVHNEFFNCIISDPPVLYGNLRGWAADFFHPLAFSLLCMSFVTNKKGRFIVCAFWFIVNTAFEIFQLIGNSFSVHNPNLIGGCFLGGTFDTYDILAFALGSFLAYLIGAYTTNKSAEEYQNESKQGVGAIIGELNTLSQ